MSVIDVEVAIRAPDAYALARRATEAMEAHKVWPTPLNYELWLHFAANPDGPLGVEIMRMVADGIQITEDISEDLAARFLPKQMLGVQIRNAGEQLSRELSAVSVAITRAQETSQAYSQTLNDTSVQMSVADETTVRRLVANLSAATENVLQENRSLEAQLAESSAEVSRLKEHLEQIRRDATTDALTNLANRKAFDDEAERAVAEAEDSGQLLHLALLDIDHFKGFNDTWGHQTGDQVIRFVASVIGGLAAPPRFAARYGGEEFAMIFPSETAERVASSLEEIRTAIASRMLKRRSTNEDLGQITISSGFAEREPGEDLISLIERADQALYASKRGGRDMVSQSRKEAQAA